MTFDEWWETDDNPWKGAEKLSEYHLAKTAWEHAQKIKIEELRKHDPETVDKILKKIIGNQKSNFEQKQVMPKVNGKSFVCECGGNVFTEYEDLKYECNSCGTKYSGEK